MAVRRGMNQIAVRESFKSTTVLRNVKGAMIDLSHCRKTVNFCEVGKLKTRDAWHRHATVLHL